MKTWLRRIAFTLALLLVVLTVVNASWIAADPQGSARLIAHRGLTQTFDRQDVGSDECSAEMIDQPQHDYLQNTARGAKRAGELYAHVVELDIAPTADGKIAVFHDRTLDCQTDGSGPVSDSTMEQLKALDIGYGYTADGGQSFPFRGKGVGELPELSEVLAALPRRTRVMYNFKSDDAAEADLLARALEEAGRDPVSSRDAFYGDAAPVERIRRKFPEAWSWSPEDAQECTVEYLAMGWTGFVPSACENGTLIIPLDRQWMYWGWPNRLISRMESVGAQVIVTGPYVSGQPSTGLTLPEQLGEIPASFNGYIWVEDAWNIAPALFPRSDNRDAAEIESAKAALERRRAEE